MAGPFRTAVLVVVDGWGVAPPGATNAVSQARPPFIEEALSKYPHAELSASGEDVGLPPGQMGNSEIGHLNIGAGKIIWQIFTLINRDIRSGTFRERAALRRFLELARTNGRATHFMGLLSDGGVHAHNNHLEALLEAARGAGLSDVHTHAFLDGRDVPPRSAEKYLEQAESTARRLGLGHVSTLQGRYFVMDRDNRWGRTEKGFRLITRGEGHRVPDVPAGIALARGRDEGDEFVQPTVIEDALPDRRGLIKEGDNVLFFNFRPDRARQVTHAFLDTKFEPFARNEGPPGQFVTMAQYGAFDREVPHLYEPIEVNTCLGSVVANAGLSQLRVAETEKYAHVTYFINGGREAPYDREERVLVPSPKVATYDLKPEMSANGIADVVVAGIASGNHALVVVNFANFDMVGHTGMLEAAKKGILVVDSALARIADATLSRDGVLVVTADHGNVEEMEQRVAGSSTPHTAHTSNPVPLLVVSAQPLSVKPGILADVAPSLLHLMGLVAPPEMTGSILVDWA